MADIITRLKFETDEFHNRARRATTEINNISQQLEKAGVRVDHMNAKNLKLAQSFGQMQTVSTTLRGKISELSEEFVAWSHHYNQITEEQRRSPYGKAIVQQLDVLRQRIQQTKGELAGIEGSLSGKVGGAGFGKQLLNGIVPGLGMGLGMAGVMAATKAMQAFKEQAIDTVKVNMEFEQSNANLSAILGKNIDEIGALTENAKMLGATTVYTAGQISELQTVLARRGLNEQQILQMTHGISNLAVATGTDLAQSAELAASTMQSFGMKAGEMERIVSVLGVSTTKSALTTQALGTSLQYVAPTARAAGFSLEDTVAMLGALVDSGLDASTAGTSLRQIILGMSTANGKLANSFGHPIRGLKDMTESIRKMKENGGASLDEISKKVRVTAVPAFLSLVENVDRLDALRDSITGVEDELQNMADKQINTLKGSTILLQSAWDGLKLSFSESNGIIKETVDLLTKLVTKVTNARKLAQGGEGAVGVFAKGVNKDKYNELVAQYGGLSYEDVNYSEMNRTATERAALPGMLDLQARYDKLNVNYKGGNDQGYFNAIAKLDEEASKYGVKSLNALVKKIAEFRDIVETSDAVLAKFNTTADDLTGTLVNDGVTGGTTGTVTIVERARDIVDKALLRYEQELKELQNRLRAGLIDQAEFDKRKVGLDENVWEAYGKADMLEPMQEWKDGMAKWGKVMKEDADIAAQSGATKKMLQAEEKYAQTFDLAAMKEDQGLQDSIAANKQRLDAEESLYNAYSALYAETKDPKYLEELDLLAEAIKSWREIIKQQEDELKRQRQIKQTDTRILNGLMGIARSNKIGYDAVGIGGQKEKIEAGTPIDPKEWQGIADRMNEELQKRGATWYIKVDFETGTLERLKTRIQEVMESFSSGVGAVKSMAGALDSCVQAGKNLAETLEGDSNAWEKMMAVVNAVITPMQAMVTVYEAVNTLKAVSAMLSDKEAVSNMTAASAKTADAVATEGLGVAEGAETVVKEVSTTATETEAAANMVAASTKAMNAHAWIPFVGAAMGAAMVATMIATMVASKNQAKSSCYFAEGGMVGDGPFQPRGTDTVPAMLTPGEIILNKAQQRALAPQLAPAMNLNNLRLSTEIRGDRLLVLLKDTAKAHGGSGKQFNIR